MISAPSSVRSYAYGTDPSQRLDVLDSPVRGVNRPVIIYVHGGAFAGGTRLDVRDLVRASLQRGYVVVSIDYRLAPANPFPQPVWDVNQAVRWVQAHAAEFGIDPAQVFLWGHSAGATLAATAAYGATTPSLIAPNLPRELLAQTGEVIGVVNEAGVMDLGQWAEYRGFGSGATPAELVGRYLGCPANGTWQGCTPAQLAAGNPMTYVKRTSPATYTIHGVQDGIVLSQIGTDFALHFAQATEVGMSWYDRVDTGPAACQNHVPDACANVSELFKFLAWQRPEPV